VKCTENYAWATRFEKLLLVHNVNVDERVLNQSFKHLVVLLFDCIVQRCLSSFVKDVEVENLLLCFLIDENNVSYCLILLLSQGNMDGCSSYLVNQVDIYSPLYTLL
jgi:hypothetical protein